MSSGLSERGGTAISITFIRKKRSSRKRPALTSERRSTFVARSTRTSTERVSLEPTRSNSCCSSTRSSLRCPGKDRVPISSRNNVPPFAASKRPIRSLFAPVNAPGSAPKSSASRSSSGSAPTLTLTNGPRLRALLATTTSANFSLPAPFGPVMSTGTSLFATCAAKAKSLAMRSLSKTGAAVVRGGVAPRSRRPGEEQLLHGADQLLVVPGLGHVVVCAFAHQLHRCLERGPRRDEQDRHRGVDRPDATEQLDPFAPRGRARAKVHVLDDHGDGARLHQLHGLSRAPGHSGRDAVYVEQDLERLGHRRLIFHDEHPRPRHGVRRCAWRRSAPPSRRGARAPASPGARRARAARRRRRRRKGRAKRRRGGSRERC